MASQFPNSVRSFTPKVDLQDTILADHINVLQDEVRAIELALNGTTDANNGLLTSSYTGSFATTASWSSVDDRLSNIERGLVNGVPSSPYFKKSGDSVQPIAGTVGLTIKTLSGTASIFEARSAANALGFNIDSVGMPKVDSAAVLYVGSAEYNTLNTTANSALETAEAVRFDPFLLAGM